MAVSKLVKTTSLSIEVQSGVDAAGDPKYSKKTFKNINKEATDQNIYDVAQSIKDIYAADTRNTLLNVTSSMESV